MEYQQAICIAKDIDVDLVKHSLLFGGLTAEHTCSSYKGRRVNFELSVRNAAPLTKSNAVLKSCV